jgi:hypothetical protein
MAGEVGLDPLTIQHIVAVPNALLNTPGISAMHAIRARSLLQSDATDTLPRLHGQSNLNETERCPSCGHLRVGSTRIQRLHTRRLGGPNKGTYTKTRVVRWTCSTCHFVLETPIPPSAGRAQHSAGQRSHRTAPIPGEADKKETINVYPTESNVISIQRPTSPQREAESLQPKSLQSAQPPVIAPTVRTTRLESPPTPALNGPPARSKSRPKNKSSLQALLAQNRKREAESAAAKSQNGLGAFLDSL